MYEPADSLRKQDLLALLSDDSHGANYNGDHSDSSNFTDHIWSPPFLKY